jgi:mono/diheme cytochrome c family protein
MFSRFRVSFVLALLLAVVLAIPVFAGGWAVITLDKLPGGVVAGEPLTIGFTVLQHGRTPMNDLGPTLNIHLDKTNAFVVPAKHDDKAGHYTATFTFPKEGNWSWSIQAFTMDQKMPDLNVAAPVVGSVIPRPVAETSPISPLVIVRVLALVIGLVGLVIAYQRKSRLALGLTVLCLVVGVASFVTGSGVPVGVEAQSKSSSEASGDLSISQVELGQQLFVAKGCITCHVNSKVTPGSDYLTIDMGAPNLSKFSASPEVLRLRLKDPTLVKSDTQMPNLHLADDEIEALIAFINSK